MSATEQISPELVLVDPVLAAEARLRLPDRPEFPPVRVSAAVASGDAPLTLAAEAAEPLWLRRSMGALLAARDAALPSMPKRRRGARVRVAVLTGTVGLATVAALVLGTPSAGRPTLLPAAPTVGTASQPGDQPSDASAADAGSTADDRSPPEAREARVFVWAAVRGAAAYEFKLFRGDKLVFRTRTKSPRLVLPARWRDASRSQSLSAGAYRWYVWAVPAGRSRPVTKAAVQARFVIRA